MKDYLIHVVGRWIYRIYSLFISFINRHKLILQYRVIMWIPRLRPKFIQILKLRPFLVSKISRYKWGVRFFRNNSKNILYLCIYTGQSFVLCQGQEGYIQCGPGKAIRILSAVYGRLSDVICPSHHVGSLTCRAPSSTDHAKWSCNGYRRCSLFADSSVFGEPCSGVNKYMEVSFHCVDQSSVNNIFG